MVKCKNCGSENPDYSVYCGRCAAELKGDPAESAKEHRPQGSGSVTSIESILSRNLLRIEENLAKKRGGALGRLKKALSRSNSIVFRSERETVTLSIDKEGQVKVIRGLSTGAALELEGRHDSFLTMFQDERKVRTIPSSISVRLGKREPTDELSQRIIREIVEEMLYRLFQ
ncbi:MAG: hypothetical protein A3K76_04790 [Euryarchaeota archaeon RBG_13_57_23]|nr:MAG: hypothetical protein A3K76_04790 [Euryarchaeota archaeon RBG_13_57_23]